MLLDGELKKAGVKGEKIIGYDNELPHHMDIGLEVLTGRADAGPGIRAVANLLDMDFIPLKWERFDLIILKDRFFEQGVQLFLGILRNEEFKNKAKKLKGYDLDHSGEMIFPQQV